MSEELDVIDIDGDGRAEVYFGGNSVCESGGAIAAVRDGKLRLLRGPDHRTLSVRRGCGKMAGNDAHPVMVLQAAWGCRGDRLVLVSARRTGRRHVRVTRTFLRIQGLRARRVATLRRSRRATGDLQLIADRDLPARCPRPAA